MRTPVELVYFLGCPMAASTSAALQNSGIPFSSVIQDHLAMDDPKRALSSPSVLVNGKQAFGGASQDGTASCTYSKLSLEEVVQAIHHWTGEPLESVRR